MNCSVCGSPETSNLEGIFTDIYFSERTCIKCSNKARESLPDYARPWFWKSVAELQEWRIVHVKWTDNRKR
jgi:hypothetical protein